MDAKNKHKNKLKSHLKDDDDTFRGVDWLVNRIQSSFFRQLSALRKNGPITDVFVTRENDENRFMLLMGYQAVRLTELHPENTIWICRMCGGSFAVSDLYVEANGGRPLTVPPNTIKIRIKINEDSSLVVTKKIIEKELTDDTEIQAVVSIVSDESQKGWLNGPWKALGNLNLFYTTESWNVETRLWRVFPQHALLPLTTWEEVKPVTYAIFVDGFC